MFSTHAPQGEQDTAIKAEREVSQSLWWEAQPHSERGHPAGEGCLRPGEEKEPKSLPPLPAVGEAARQPQPTPALGTAGAGQVA